MLVHHVDQVLARREHVAPRAEQPLDSGGRTEDTSHLGRLARDGITVRGVRLDSGDLAAHARQVRAILDQGGLRQVRIFASGGLDEWQLRELAATAPIDGYGIGTSLTVSVGGVVSATGGAGGTGASKNGGAGGAGRIALMTFQASGDSVAGTISLLGTVTPAAGSSGAPEASGMTMSDIRWKRRRAGRSRSGRRADRR